jgi:ribosomal protein S7
MVEDKEFYIFLKKFVGSLIFRGNKSRAIKMFDEILYSLKCKFNKDPIFIFYTVFKKLVPIFSIAYKRVGNKYQPVPKFANKNVRIVLINDWLIRSLKGKSNTRGVKVSDIIKVIVDTYYDKGKALANKKAFYKRALSGRHLLSTYKKRNKRVNLRSLRAKGVNF